METADELDIRFNNKELAENLTSLTYEEIQEFKQIVKKVKDIDLTDQQAEDQASRMVKLSRLIMQKLTIEKRQS